MNFCPLQCKEHGNQAGDLLQANLAEVSYNGTKVVWCVGWAEAMTGLHRWWKLPVETWIKGQPDMARSYNGANNRIEAATGEALTADAAGFTRIYDEHMAYIFRYINYRVGNRAVAEDLTSVVFEKALASFKQYRKEKAAPQTWLVTIARNTVIDYLRQSAKKGTVPIEKAFDIESKEPSPQEEAERLEVRERLKFCIAALASHEQEVVSLKFGAELNNRCIASELNLSDSNVGTILFRALCKLRNCVKEWLNGKGKGYRQKI